MTGVTVRALPSDVRVAAGDDVAAILLDACRANGVTLVDGDVLAVASKVVALAEGRTIAAAPTDRDRDARRAAARARAARVVVDTPQVLVTATRHGHVAANGGIDATNTGGRLLDLPDDPDGAAAALRDGIAAATGVQVGVVVTDTAGRPWREGQVDVALGVAGIPALRDERGRRDLDGVPLAVTVAAVADAVAGATDLVRDKATGAPFVLLRGTGLVGLPGPTGAVALHRDPARDLFLHGGPQAVVAGLVARRTVRRFAPGPVPDHVLEEAVRTAVTAPAPHHTRPLRVVRVTDATRPTLLAEMARRWRDDLLRDAVPTPVVERRIARSDALLGAAPVLLAPFVATDGAHQYPDLRRARAERDLFVLAGGAALEALLVALSAHGLGAAWVSAPVFCADVARGVLATPPDWQPLGLVAVGTPAADARPRPRAPIELEDVLLER